MLPRGFGGRKIQKETFKLVVGFTDLLSKIDLRCSILVLKKKEIEL